MLHSKALYRSRDGLLVVVVGCRTYFPSDFYHRWPSPACCKSNLCETTGPLPADGCRRELFGHGDYIFGTAGRATRHQPTVPRSSESSPTGERSEPSDPVTGFPTLHAIPQSEFLHAPSLCLSAYLPSASSPIA